MLLAQKVLHQEQDNFSNEMESAMNQKETIPQSPSLQVERRSCRRHRFSSFINFRHMGIRGRRKRARRRGESQNYYVDHYQDPILFFVVLAIIIMSTLDAIFTILLLENGNIIEANPLMAALIEKSSLYFFNVKFLLTALSLFLLVIHKNFTFLGAFKTTHVIFLIFGGFCILNTYQIFLLIS
jgi:hypothetical protein